MIGHIGIPRLRCVTVPTGVRHPMELVRPENWVRGEHYTRKGFSLHTVNFFHDSYYEQDGRTVVLREIERCVDTDGLRLRGRTRTVHELHPDGSEDVWPA